MQRYKIQYMQNEGNIINPLEDVKLVNGLKSKFYIVKHLYNHKVQL